MGEKEKKKKKKKRELLKQIAGSTWLVPRMQACMPARVGMDRVGMACMLILAGTAGKVKKADRSAAPPPALSALPALPASPGRIFFYITTLLLLTWTRIDSLLLFFTFHSFLFVFFASEAVCSRLVSIFDHHNSATSAAGPTTPLLGATTHANAADGQFLSVCTSSRLPTFIRFFEYNIVAKLGSTYIRFNLVLGLLASDHFARLRLLPLSVSLSHLYSPRPSLAHHPAPAP